MSASSTVRHDLLVVGNYCHDRLIHAPGQERFALGGSASYISAVLTAMRADFAVSAVVGEDFRYATELPHHARVAPGARTTEFTADFTRGERVLTLGAESPPILPEDIHVDARVSLVCGVAGEIRPDTLARVAERSEHVLADIQGLFRTTDIDRRIVHRRLETTPFWPLIDRLTMLKASEIEAESLDLAETRRRTCLVITRGERGCTVLTARDEIHVPAFPAKEVDPTGAGDCFMAGFALGLLRGGSLAESARLGNWCGARAVEQVGVPKLDLSAAPKL